MKRYKKLLKEALERHGWELISRHDESAWWAEERWMVRLVCRDWRIELCITFLVDLQWIGEDKSAGVREIIVNQFPPTECPYSEPGLSRIRIDDVHFHQAIEEFVAAMDGYASGVNQGSR